MENNDDKKHFEIVVYGQRKPNQSAEADPVSDMQNNMRTRENKVHACAGQHRTRGCRRQSTGPWHFRPTEVILVY